MTGQQSCATAEIVSNQKTSDFLILVPELIRVLRLIIGCPKAQLEA